MMIYIKDGDKEYLLERRTIVCIKHVDNVIVIQREDYPDLVIKEREDLWRKIVGSKIFESVTL
jgi:hypothetical protein